MTIAIAAISSQYIHMPLAPFVLKKALCESGFTHVFIPDVNINDTPENLTERILECKPDVVCFCVYIWNREMTCRIAGRIKAAFPEIKIVLGGPEVTYSVRETFSQIDCDYIIRGAGEKPLSQLIMQLENGSQGEIEGVCTREKPDGAIALPPAPRDDIYDEEWHKALSGRMAYVETSRGCPFSCAFCLSGRREKVQFMEKEKALELLIRAGNSGADTVKIIDRTFNCSHERTAYLLEGVIQAKKQGKIGDVCYHMEVGADLFSDEELEILAKAPAGLMQMEAGLQSFNISTLEKCSRHTDMVRLCDRIRRIVAMGNIHLHIDLIAGLPEENMASFADSFDKAYSLHPNQLQLGFLKLIYGSRLRECCWGQRYDPKPPYEIMGTPWISYSELEKLHHCAEAVEKILNSGRFQETLKLISESSAIAPFSLFMDLGERIHSFQGKVSTETVTEIMLAECRSLQIPTSCATDALIMDRLASDMSPHIPSCLRQTQEKYEIAKKEARRMREENPQVKSVRFAYLEGSDRVVLAAWEKKNPATMRGETVIIPVK